LINDAVNAAILLSDRNCNALFPSLYNASQLKFSPTVFKAPDNKGGDDPLIVDTVGKYFNFGFTGILN
jgi:hypothetical protein